MGWHELTGHHPVSDDLFDAAIIAELGEEQGERLLELCGDALSIVETYKNQGGAL